MCQCPSQHIDQSTLQHGLSANMCHGAYFSMFKAYDILAGRQCAGTDCCMGAALACCVLDPDWPATFVLRLSYWVR